jgi:hypothetical protein
MSKDLVALQYPKLFQGVFARRREVYIPLVEEARRSLHSLPVPEALRPFYDTVVRDNPQPSFMLLPLMFLAMAESSGGIQPVHRRFLPVLILTMEVCAIVDDTVDRTPMRSGRRTFALRFGEPSTTPFVGSLIALAAQEAARVDPSLLDSTMRLFTELYALQMWERQHLYPNAGLFSHWLDNRYRENTLGVSFGLDTALRLNGRQPLPLSVVEAFGRIFQDVDDLVNVIEDRRSEGENDDVLMGAVTRPLLVAIENQAGLLADVSNLWRVCRIATGTSAAAVHRTPAHLNPTIAKLYRPIHEAILNVGVRGTVQHVLADYRTSVLTSPPEFRPAIQEMTCTWVDRLRRCKGTELLTEEEIRHTLEDVPLEAA